MTGEEDEVTAADVIAASELADAATEVDETGRNRNTVEAAQNTKFLADLVSGRFFKKKDRKDNKK